MPKLNDLKPGDLICELDEDDDAHFIMWVGGTDALVENTDAIKYNGVFRHSDSRIRKYLSTKTGTDEDGSHDNDEVRYLVFRCLNEAIAEQAASFAIEWATSKHDDIFIKGMNSKKDFSLKIPFSQDRLMHKREQDSGDWNALSLFRALRVLARHNSNMPVSKKGLTCSSFATYCFQAATLKILFKDHEIPESMLDTIRRENSETFLSIKNDSNIVKSIFDDKVNVVKELASPGILVDGKAIYADELRESLERADSQFNNLDYITN